MLYAMTALSTPNQIPFWVNYNCYGARLKIKVTHLFLSLFKQLTQADSMLQ
jgi:hypothetical protein